MVSEGLSHAVRAAECIKWALRHMLEAERSPARAEQPGCPEIPPNKMHPFLWKGSSSLPCSKWLLRPATPNTLRGAPEARWQTRSALRSFPFDFRKGTRNWPATPISGLLNQKPVWSSQVGAAQPQCPPPLTLLHPSRCPHLKHAVLTQAGARAEPHTTPLGTSLRAPTMIYKQYRQTKKQRWW